MIAAELPILNELNLFMDEQTLQVTETLNRIDMLRAAVIRRDKGALEELSEQVKLQAVQKKQDDMKQQKIQQKLADFCQCSVQEANVSRLCEHLTGQERQAIQLKQSKLQGLILKLNNECRAAELMLRECVRFNRLLLRSLVGNQNQTQTYTAQGKEQWSMHWGLMNTKL